MITKIVFIGAHLGYPLERTPLGGGAMVGAQLLRHWSAAGQARILAVGPGSCAPQGVEYRRAEAGCGAKDPDIVNLSASGYGRFCRAFEESTTRFLLENSGLFSPEETAVVVNDISEAPDLRTLSRRGWRITTIWHVDVVDFFNRIYLGEVLPVERITGLYGLCERAGLQRFLPDILRIVFAKQKAAVEESRRLIVPSSAMARTLLRAYPDARPSVRPALAKRLRVIPWGTWEEELDSAQAEDAAERLRRHFRIGPGSRVLMTLSRISPEKGLDRVLAALSRLEKDSPHDLCAFICGEAAFMGAAGCLRRLRAQAARLRRARVFFPGHLSSDEKKAFFLIAQLFVSASRHESYGLTIVEALRASLPVLACGHYGAEDLLAEEYGRVVPEGVDPGRGLEKELRFLLSDPVRLREMGLRGREASKRMDFSCAAKALLEELRAG